MRLEFSSKCVCLRMSVKSVPSLFRGWGPDGGDGQGESQESWEADPAGRWTDGLAGEGEGDPIVP